MEDRTRILYGKGLIMYHLLVILFLIVSLPCGEAQECEEFVEIPEDQYDRNYSSIHETDKRPLGFHRSAVYYNDPDQPDPCFKLSGLGGKQVEILFETIPASKLCFKDKDGLMEECGDNRYENCFQAVADTMEFEFYCNQAVGCSEAQVNFWLRLTSGPPPEEDTEGMWCMNRGSSEYPEDLAPLPTDVTLPTVPPTPSAGSKTYHIPVLLGVLTLVACSLNKFL